MNGKRVTIYDLARELGISASYVSRALNDQKGISEKIKEAVKNKAVELNYRHNSRAANLRRGSSKTLGVIVPHINQSFFSEAIAGIEEACFKNNYSLIICQSHESFKQECLAVATLIHHNVDCVLISISAETKTAMHLDEIITNHIGLVQFDRYLDAVDSYKVVNDNREVSYHAVQHLIQQGYHRIAFIGGPDYLSVFKQRKEGYLEAIETGGLTIPAPLMVDNAFSKEAAIAAANTLLRLPEPPDAFFTVTDFQALGIIQVANELNISIPGQLGVFGFANEAFTQLIKPSLSSINQNSKELGKCAADLYFDNMEKNTQVKTFKKIIMPSEIIIRESSSRQMGKTSYSRQ